MLITDTGRMAITPRQQRFIEHYLQSGNATAAYLAAGFKVNVATARSNGHRLLLKPEIKAELDSRTKTMMDRLKMTTDDVLSETCIIGTSSIGHYTTDGEGNITTKEGIDPARLRAIASYSRVVKYAGDGTKEVREKFTFWDKNAALNRAAKHLGMDGPEVKVDAEDTMTAEEKTKRMLALLQLALARQQMAEAEGMNQPAKVADLEPLAKGRSEADEQWHEASDEQHTGQFD